MAFAFGLSVKISISKITIRNQERKEREKSLQFSFGKSFCLLIGLLFATKFARKKRKENVSCSLPSANARIIWWKCVLMGIEDC